MYDLERPRDRLIHHFIKRIFYGAGDGDDLQFGIPALLGLLSTPSAFGAIALFGKYSTLALYLTNRPFIDVYRASVPDEYFFIVYSMVITGAVVILKWDRLFPDRQDYDNLAILPISSLQIFGSSLIALLFLAAIFAIDINWAACVIFPFAVTARYDTFGAYSEFFIGHGSAVLLASLFACFSLLSIMAVTIFVVPQRYLRPASLIMRIGCALMLMATFASAFSLPRLLLSQTPPDWVRFVPPVWFLDLHQFVLGRGSPFSGSPMFALEATGGAFLFSLLAYAFTYYRQFTRIPERSAVQPGKRRDGASIIGGILDRTFVRTPFQRAAYYFSLKTLFRSERHCLLFGAAVGVGVFVTAQTLSDAVADPLRIGYDSRLLSIPLTLSYFVICSLRALYDLPTDRDANWIFRATIDRESHESRSVGVKVMLTMIAPWLLLIVLPLSATKWGWSTALLHTGYVLVCATALAELLLTGFRKIPFTCSRVMNKDHVLVMVIFFLVGLWFFGPTNAVIESRLLQSPWGLALAPLLLAGVIFCVNARERQMPSADRSLVFEDWPAPSIQVLDLRFAAIKMDPIPPPITSETTTHTSNATTGITT